MVNNSENDKFALTIKNDKVSRNVLSSNRPPEGRYIKSSFVGPCYFYEKTRILYISDIHLDNIIDSYKCQNDEEIDKVLQKVGNSLEKSFLEIAGYIHRNTLTIIAGDTTHSPEIFGRFMRMDFTFLKNAVVILGNHELWAYPKLKLDSILIRYSKLSPCRISQNEILLYNSFELPRCTDSQFEPECFTSLKQDEILKLSTKKLAKKMSECKLVLLTGIGFSGYNNDFNATNGIYRNTITRQEEIEETKKFEKLYNHFIKSAKLVNNTIFVIATHMPLPDWCKKNKYEDKFIYIHGHTHRNFYIENGYQRIYADNQNGYYKKQPKFKCIYAEEVYDNPFSDFQDGIHEITTAQYIYFHKYKRINLNISRDFKVLYMLKKNDYYCFIAKLASGKLSLLNGARGTQLAKKDVNYYYERMDKAIDILLPPLIKYTQIQEQLSKEIKVIGGEGTIHGCIVDIDYYNHIYVNPFDLTIKGYYATDIVNKYIYDTIPNLLEEELPRLYTRYQKQLEKGRMNVLVPISVNTHITKNFSQEYLETDIYKPSREMSKLQKLNKNILCFWNENLFADEEPKQLQSIE